MLKYCYCSSEMVRTYKKCKRLMLFKQTLHPGKNLVPVWWQPVKFSQSDFFLQTEGAPHQPSSPDSPGVARRISSRLGWGDCERRRSPFRERTITSFGSKQTTFFFFFLWFLFHLRPPESNALMLRVGVQCCTMQSSAASTSCLMKALLSPAFCSKALTVPSSSRSIVLCRCVNSSPRVHKATLDTPDRRFFTWMTEIPPKNTVKHKDVQFNYSLKQKQVP